jgi:hypothetical protein
VEEPEGVNENLCLHPPDGGVLKGRVECYERSH